MNGSPIDRIRAFIAARPNSAAQAELVRVQSELKKRLAPSGLRIQWTDPDTFHGTILFLGDIPTSATPRIFQALEKTEVRPVPFDICALELVQSELLPSGARHTVLSRISGSSCP